MSALGELGKAFKKKYPAYEDLTDEEAGRAAKVAFPGKYDDVPETSLALRPSQSLEATQRQLQHRLDSLWNPRDAKMGTIVAWFKSSQMEQNNRYLQKVNEQQAILIRQAVQVSEAIINGKKAEYELDLFIANNRSELAALKIAHDLRTEAAEHGMTIPAYEKKKLAEAESERRIEEAEHQSYLRIQEEEAAHKRKLKEIEHQAELDRKTREFHAQGELSREIELANAEIDLATKADHLVLNQQILLIQKQIDEQYDAIEAIEASRNSPEIKRRKIADREAIIEGLIKQRNEASHRLISKNNGTKT